MDTPRQVGRYQVVDVLGRGAMGIVLRAHDPAIGRQVAIKLVRADLLEGAERESYLVRFQQEAQAAGRCSHPNIVAVYDFALHEGNPFIAMEFVEGESLAQRLARGERFSVADAVSITVDVLAALECAHGQGVVHRDIKPANVLLSGGRVRVMDFGISRMPDSTLTHGFVLGTPSYMSPEQCRGGDVDHRSDLFSTGTLLFELLTGTRPFAGKSYTEIAVKLVHDEALSLATHLPGAPPALAGVVRRALARKPEDRFASAAAMARSLRQALDDQDDRTVMHTRAPAPALAGVTLDAETLSTLQRRLAHHVGPIARHLVSSAARSATSLDALCDSLASRITSVPDREAFRTAARKDCQFARTESAGPETRITLLSTPSLSNLATGAVTPVEALRAQTELTQHIGPIARVLVKRALARAETVQEFWTMLAQHVERPQDRAAFLAQQRRG